MESYLWFVILLCINIYHCSLYNCEVTSTGAIALGKGLQENTTLEILQYVTNTLSFARNLICGCPEWKTKGEGTEHYFT